MPEEKIVTVDFDQEDACSAILPRSPLVSSYHAKWAGIRLDHHRQPSHETPEHYFHQHTIGISLDRGIKKAERVLNGLTQRESIAHGDVTVIPANTHHISRCESGGEFILLSLEPAFFNRIALETVDLQNIEITPHFFTPDPLIQQIGLALKSELESDDMGTRIYIESLANTLCIHLLKRYGADQKNIPQYTHGKGLSRLKLQQAMEYIHDNLDKDLSLAEISAVVSMSMYHFSRLFKQSTGFAPHQYVINCRIEKAKILLTRSEKTIDQIYQLVGFQNQSHFTNVFRKLMGTTPKVYREQVR
ncbi:DNA-binding domain-containing protein, AraC-type [Cylindrospermum stagnale PCC 7417]|uniref:DNA-binding domain-containing protein, AraC-type n=1 Tax=Cylindrospermum stagnale PCC 7417 TaxID=56107 RepID=K9X7E4_9NOST|nr:AraC family transcriptional regulator [Cylindrospermum stagnale]AFZ27557.1 DNA-binding domain-containing protein, AraC-type [Cylindrospermum stagnale PCC 7417]